MLADVNLQELPLDVLVAIRDAADAEIRYRETYNDLKWPGLLGGAAAAQRALWTGMVGRQAVALPLDVRHAEVQERLPYLAALLAQDWDVCFPNADMQRKDFYVYAHIDPREKRIQMTPEVGLRGLPFYIGKGTGRRAWDLKRNQGHGKRIQTIRDVGFAESAMVEIIAKELTEQQALSLEAKLIYFFGSIYDEMAQGCLLNLADQARPIFLQEMQPLAVLGKAPKRLRSSQKARIDFRWQKWQETLTNQVGLTKEQRDMGYTIAIVPPVGRKAFLDTMKLITLYQRVSTSDTPRKEIDEIWRRWERWTTRVGQYINRLSQHQKAAFPQLPFTV